VVAPDGFCKPCISSDSISKLLESHIVVTNNFTFYNSIHQGRDKVFWCDSISKLPISQVKISIIEFH